MSCSMAPIERDFRQNMILILSTHTHTHTTHTHTHTHTHKSKQEKEINFICLDFVEFTLSLGENIICYIFCRKPSNNSFLYFSFINHNWNFALALITFATTVSQV